MPEFIREGGPEDIVVHRLPSGKRTIDILGRDDKPFEWTGTFLSAQAEADIRTLDGMRVAGLIYPLTFGGLNRRVVISDLEWRYRRSNWVDYRIECTAVFDADDGAPAGGVPPAAQDQNNAAQVPLGIPP